MCWLKDWKLFYNKYTTEKNKMAAKCFIDGTFFVPVCTLCLKFNLISFSILCFSIFLCFTLFDAIIWIFFFKPLDVALISLLV